MSKTVKSNIVKFVIALISIIILLLLGWNIFLSRWKIRSSEDINSIKLYFTLNDHYSEVIITDKEEIHNIKSLVSDMEKKITAANVADVKEIEKFQKDSQVSLTFEFNNVTQEICVHKNSVLIYDYCNGSNYKDMYFLRLKNMDTSELLEEVYLYLNETE